MPSRIRTVSWLALTLCLTLACSKEGSGEARGAPGSPAARGNDTSIPVVRAAAHALAQPDSSVDFVASKMRGVIKARTNSQALIQYDGYRATLTTPGNRVTSISFDFTEAKPTIAQLTKELGTPEPVGRGMLYEYHAAATGSTIRVLAEPVSKPATDTSLVRRILVEGAPIR